VPWLWGGKEAEEALDLPVPTADALLPASIVRRSIADVCLVVAGAKPWQHVA
jgi:hypothetical protein